MSSCIVLNTKLLLQALAIQLLSYLWVGNKWSFVHLQMTVMLAPNASSIIEQLSYRALYLFSLTWFFCCVFLYRMAPKSKRHAGRTDGENEGEEVAAQSARSNVGRKCGRANQDPVRGGRAGKRATNSARGGRVGKGPPIPPLVMKEGEI